MANKMILFKGEHSGDKQFKDKSTTGCNVDGSQNICYPLFSKSLKPGYCKC